MTRLASISRTSSPHRWGVTDEWFRHRHSHPEATPLRWRPGQMHQHRHTPGGAQEPSRERRRYVPMGRRTKGERRTQPSQAWNRYQSEAAPRRPASHAPGVSSLLPRVAPARPGLVAHHGDITGPDAGCSGTLGLVRAAQKMQTQMRTQQVGRAATATTAGARPEPTRPSRPRPGSSLGSPPVCLALGSHAKKRERGERGRYLWG